MDPEMPRPSENKLKRKFLTYRGAEIVYSLPHIKVRQIAQEAGAIYRFPGFVLINREIFDKYLEEYHEPPRIIPHKS